MNIGKLLSKLGGGLGKQIAALVIAAAAQAAIDKVTPKPRDPKVDQ